MQFFSKKKPELVRLFAKYSTNYFLVSHLCFSTPSLPLQPQCVFLHFLHLVIPWLALSATLETLSVLVTLPAPSVVEQPTANTKAAAIKVALMMFFIFESLYIFLKFLLALPR